MNSLQESAWLAAMIDAEACFGAYKYKQRPNGRPRLQLYLKMCDLDVVERFRQICNAEKYAITECDSNKQESTIRHKEVSKNPKENKLLYAVTIRGYAAENSIRRAMPYLGERKKAKAERDLMLDLSHHTKRD